MCLLLSPLPRSLGFSAAAAALPLPRLSLCQGSDEGKVLLDRAETGLTALKHDGPIVINICSQEAGVAVLAVCGYLSPVADAPLSVLRVVGADSPEPGVCAVSVQQELCDSNVLS